MTHKGDAAQRMVLEFRAREAWSQRNYASAQAWAEQWAATSLQDDEDEGWWNASHLKAEALRKQGRMNASQLVADELAAHALTRRSAVLRARVLTLRAFALQGSGDLAGAVQAARDATVEAHQVTDHNDIEIEAQNALIAALAESGRLEDAWVECTRLADLLEAEADGQTTGMGYWAIGNVAFLLKRIEEGVDYHDRAARTLSPTNDLDLWSRFNRGSANFRLAAGVLGPETLECIERAEMAGSIVGGTERDKVELTLIRAQWLVLSAQFDAAGELLATIIERKAFLASHTAAQAHFLLGQTLLGRGKRSDAVTHLTLSEQMFAQSGAEDRASTARELIDSVEHWEA